MCNIIFNSYDNLHIFNLFLLNLYLVGWYVKWCPVSRVTSKGLFLV